jgi:hypothetical protein
MAVHSTLRSITDTAIADLPLDTRIQLAFDEWKAANSKAKGSLSVTKAAQNYYLYESTLRRRIAGGVSRKQAAQAKQRLTPGEEQSLHDWIVRLEEGGFPARPCQCLQMAQEILALKGDTAPIGVNWLQKFLKRFPQLQSRFIPPLDKERLTAQDPVIISDWFQLYVDTKAKYHINDVDTWNMDEKGCPLGVIGMTKVIVSRSKRKKYMTQCGNREWVSLIECVNIAGAVLDPFVIFKGKVQMRDWWDHFSSGHIAVSANRWTTNELCLEWLKKCFDPGSKKHQVGEYRILIFDGHASHISSEAIQFCTE